MEVENILEPAKWKLGNTFVILLENNSILFTVNKVIKEKKHIWWYEFVLERKDLEESDGTCISLSRYAFSLILLKLFIHLHNSANNFMQLFISVYVVNSEWLPTFFHMQKKKI